MLVAEHRRKWWVLTAMGGVMGVILLDETVVGVALPTMRHDLAMSEATSHWVINAYLLVFAGLAAAGGKMGDLIGHKVTMLGAVLLFGLSSLACGFAVDGTTLIVARIVQGIGAALIFPVSLAMVSIAFPPDERGMALGIYSAAGTCFLALGPFVGGLMIDVLSWRWIFWINPFVAAAIGFMVLAAWRDPERDAPPGRMDWPGLVTLVAGLSMIVFALMEGPELGWADPIILGLLVGGFAMMAIFTIVEARIKPPLIDIAMFRSGSFTVSNLVIFAAQFNQMAVVIFGALYLQDILGMSPLMTGVALLVAVGAVPITAVPTGRLTDRWGAKKVALTGLLMATVAQLWLGIASGWQSYAVMIPALTAWGMANAAMFVAPRHIITAAIPIAKHGQASGIMMTMQQLGATLGVAVMALFYTITGSYGSAFFVTCVMTFLVLVLTVLFVRSDSSGADRSVP
ncbi:MAG: MFS transporter [Pseudomonadota bacterium]